MNDINRLEEEQRKFEALYREHYEHIYRLAQIKLRKYNSLETYVLGRAEEVAQSTFGIAWEKREEFFDSPSPLGWLIRAVHYKAQEVIRDEYTWTKKLLRFSETVTADGAGEDFRLRVEMLSIISEEEYNLLKMLYLDGASYKELSQLQGVKLSTLAMRVKRIKERISREYKE